MPTATDLVTDLPADFAVFGQAVATSMQYLLGGTTGQILSKTSATDMAFTWIANDQGDITGITAGTGITVTSPTGPVPTVAIDTAVTVDKTTAQTLTNKTLTSPALTTPTISTLTTNGDLLYGTGSGVLARQGIGSAGQVLTVTAGIPAWATPSAGASANYSLLNAGGTALTAAATITVSGISGMSSIMILVRGASTTSALGSLNTIRLNADATSGNYEYYGANNVGYSTYSAAVTTSATGGTTATSFALGRQSLIVSGTVDGYCEILGANTAGIKTMKLAGAGSVASSNSQEQFIACGIYKGTSTISSVSIISSAGNFDAGTIFIYGSAV